MPGLSPLKTAEKALVGALLALGSAYDVTVRVDRDSADNLKLWPKPASANFDLFASRS